MKPVEIIGLFEKLIDTSYEGKLIDEWQLEQMQTALGVLMTLVARKNDGDRLADEIAVLVRRRIIDSRSPAADALLDYRDPPSSERADRIADLEIELEELNHPIVKLHDSDFIVSRGERLMLIRRPDDLIGLYIDGDDPSPMATEGDRVIIIHPVTTEK